MKGRTALLLVAFVVLAAFVLMDVTASGETSDGEAVTARERYKNAAALAAQMQGLIERESEYASALDETTDRWDDAQRRMVTATSAELARLQFRDRLLEFVRRREVDGVETSMVESSAIGDDQRLQLLRARLEFQTPSTRAVYEIVDQLEHVRDLITRVADVELSGPGRIPRDKRVIATVTVEALAFVEGGG